MLPSEKYRIAYPFNLPSLKSPTYLLPLAQVQVPKQLIQGDFVACLYSGHGGESLAITPPAPPNNRAPRQTNLISNLVVLRSKAYRYSICELRNGFYLPIVCLVALHFKLTFTSVNHPLDTGACYLETSLKLDLTPSKQVHFLNSDLRIRQKKTG